MCAEESFDTIFNLGYAGGDVQRPPPPWIMGRENYGLITCLPKGDSQKSFAPKMLENNHFKKLWISLPLNQG